MSATPTELSAMAADLRPLGREQLLHWPGSFQSFRRMWLEMNN